MNKKYRQGILAAVLLLAWGSYSAGSKKALQELMNIKDQNWMCFS